MRILICKEWKLRTCSVAITAILVPSDLTKVYQETGILLFVIFVVVHTEVGELIPRWTDQQTRYLGGKNSGTDHLCSYTRNDGAEENEACMSRIACHES